MSLDAAEALTNATVGIALSVAAVHVLWPVFGWAVTTGQSIAVTAVFWLLSAARSYALRKVFRRMGHG